MRRLRRQDGYTVIETLVVLAILGTVMGSLTGLFVAGTTAELDMNERFQAQQNARLALSKLRREVHCASSATTTSSSVTLQLGSYCKTGTGAISWCAVSTGTGRYGLYRKAGSTCDATGMKWADYLTSSALFTYVAQSTTSLAKLGIVLPVDLDPNDAGAAYRLDDEIVLRNSTRS